MTMSRGLEASDKKGRPTNPPTDVSSPSLPFRCLDDEYWPHLLYSDIPNPAIHLAKYTFLMKYNETMMIFYDDFDDVDAVWLWWFWWWFGYNDFDDCWVVYQNVRVHLGLPWEIWKYCNFSSSTFYHHHDGHDDNVFMNLMLCCWCWWWFYWWSRECKDALWPPWEIQIYCTTTFSTLPFHY